MDGRRRRTRKGPKGADSRPDEAPIDGRTDFIVNTFNVICDSLISELRSRSLSYRNLNDRFNLFLSYTELSVDDWRMEAAQLAVYYDKDVEFDCFIEESVHFLLLCDKMEIYGPKSMVLYIFKNNLSSTYPNVDTILRIYLTIASTNCGAERSFSALKRIKSWYRSTMSNERFQGLSLLAIENQVTCDLSYNDVISDFAMKKARKVFI